MKKMSGDKKEPDLVAEEEEKEMQDSEAATSKQENSKSGQSTVAAKYGRNAVSVLSCGRSMFSLCG